MNPDIKKIIDESIAHELIISDLYMLFHKLFPMDSGLWWILLLEEKNHAALIEGLRNSLAELNDFPRDVVVEHQAMLIRLNAKLNELIQIYQMDPPSREDALRMALDIETSAAEQHFQHFMEAHYPDELLQMVQQINRNDKDHALRIQMYMNEQGIRR